MIGWRAMPVGFCLCVAKAERHRVPCLLRKTRPRVMRRLFQASIHDEDHPERPSIESGNLLAADICGP
jgi:hypothetical protein